MFESCQPSANSRSISVALFLRQKAATLAGFDLTTHKLRSPRWLAEKTTLDHAAILGKPFFLFSDQMQKQSVKIYCILTNLM
jgi:hypothetical protein